VANPIHTPDFLSNEIACWDKQAEAGGDARLVFGKAGGLRIGNTNADNV
jgi:hypothetical protein